MSFHAPQQLMAPAVLVQRIAAELGFAREHLHRVELVLEGAVLGPAGINNAAAAAPVSGDPDARLPKAGEMQSLDLVLQILGDLEVCLVRLAQSQTMSEVAPTDMREVLRPLCLADLQRRLAGLGPPGRATPMELF